MEQNQSRYSDKQPLRKRALETSSYDRSLARSGLTGLIVVVAAVCLSTPGKSAWLPGCVFFNLTGLYCPGCGSTRMLYYLVHGHPIEAFHYNPLTLLVLPVVLYALIRKSFHLRLPAPPQLSRPWMTAFAFAVVLFTIARNIPAEPFCKLAPGGISRGNALKTLSSLYPSKNPGISHITIRLPVKIFLDKG